MKYIDEFRDPLIAKRLISQINAAVDPRKTYRLMEFCGGHTHTLFRYGIPDMLPSCIELLHGPGCPVCVLPIVRVDMAISLAMREDTILCSYGDVLRVPGSNGDSLLKCQARGGGVTMITSPSQCIALAQSHPDKRIIFFAVGFETTTPPTAAVLAQAIALQLDNFQILCNHVLTPPAMEGIFSEQTATENAHPHITETMTEVVSNDKLNGLIGPGHVSLITGTDAFDAICKTHKIPIVVSGFEPSDLLHSILMLVLQINHSNYQVENQYTRAAKPEGNQIAQSIIAKYFERRSTFEWRGLGQLPDSALNIKSEYAHYNAEIDAPHPAGAADNKACECPAVLRGQKKPTQCKLFGNPCTPENPLGTCMVSSEGTCAAYYLYHPTEEPEPQAERVAELIATAKHSGEQP